MAKILQTSELTKIYKSGNHSLTVLKNISFALEEGASCAIVGPSGSGKTTLLGLCAGLDRPTSGWVRLNDIPIFSLSEDERAGIRNQYVGFIFQTFQLMPTLTALENVMIPLELRNEKNIRHQAADWLVKVGLKDRLHHYPAQLSGGEQQRVAIARAFINRPKILFADEPTGNLDMDTGQHIEHLLFELNRETGTTLLLVTHEMELARKCEQRLPIRGGMIEEDHAEEKTGEKG